MPLAIGAEPEVAAGTPALRRRWFAEAARDVQLTRALIASGLGFIYLVGFDPLHLVNTYGAFGSVSRERHEVVLEGAFAPEGESEDQLDWKGLSPHQGRAGPGGCPP